MLALGLLLLVIWITIAYVKRDALIFVSIVMAVGLGSILASSIVRPGPAGSQAPESSSDPRLSPTNGPGNLSAIVGLRRHRQVTATTNGDTLNLPRPAGSTSLPPRPPARSRSRRAS